MTLAAIPSPSTAVWHVFGLPIRAYALCIILGIVVACLVTEVRLRQRGVAPWVVLDMAVWVVPFGIVGARLYHVISSPQGYFGEGGTPIEALYIWEGGLGIWGGVAGGALGAWFAARQLGLPLSVFADALAPGLPLAQAVGRLGNWFNNELYGGVTTLPWGLQVHDMDRANPGRATVIDGQPVVLPDLYHPTFLYEALWNIGVAVLVLVLDRRFRFGRGRAFALYVMGYTVGRFWIEMMRTDEANAFFGVRVNVYTSVLVFLGALAYFLLVKGSRGYVVPVEALTPAPQTASAGGVSAVDVSTGDEPRSATPPVAYRLVSRERFEAYRRTGVVPPEEEPAGSPPDTLPDSRPQPPAGSTVTPPQRTAAAAPATSQPAPATSQPAPATSQPAPATSQPDPAAAEASESAASARPAGADPTSAPAPAPAPAGADAPAADSATGESTPATGDAATGGAGPDARPASTPVRSVDEH